MGSSVSKAKGRIQSHPMTKHTPIESGSASSDSSKGFSDLTLIETTSRDSPYSLSSNGNSTDLFKNFTSIFVEDLNETIGINQVLSNNKQLDALITVLKSQLLDDNQIHWQHDLSQFHLQQQIDYHKLIPAIQYEFQEVDAQLNKLFYRIPFSFPNLQLSWSDDVQPPKDELELDIEFNNEDEYFDLTGFCDYHITDQFCTCHFKPNQQNPILDDGFFQPGLDDLIKHLDSNISKLPNVDLFLMNSSLFHSSPQGLSLNSFESDVRTIVEQNHVFPIVSLLHFSRLIEGLTSQNDYKPMPTPQLLGALNLQTPESYNNFICSSIHSDIAVLNGSNLNPLLVLKISKNRIDHFADLEYATEDGQNLLSRLHAYCLLYETDIVVLSDGFDTTVFKFNLNGSKKPNNNIDYQYRTFNKDDSGLTINWVLSSLIFQRFKTATTTTTTTTNIPQHINLNKSTKTDIIHTKQTRTKSFDYYAKKSRVEKHNCIDIDLTNPFTQLDRDFSITELSLTQDVFTSIYKISVADYITLFKINPCSVDDDIDHVVIKTLDFNKVADYFSLHKNTMNLSFDLMVNWFLSCYDNELEAYNLITNHNAALATSTSTSTSYNPHHKINTPRYLSHGWCNITTPTHHIGGLYIAIEYLDFVNVKPNHENPAVLEMLNQQVEQLSSLGIDHCDLYERNLCFDEKGGDGGLVYLYDFNRARIY